MKVHFEIKTIVCLVRYYHQISRVKAPLRKNLTLKNQTELLRFTTPVFLLSWYRVLTHFNVVLKTVLLIIIENSTNKNGILKIFARKKFCNLKINICFRITCTYAIVNHSINIIQPFFFSLQVNYEYDLFRAR